MKIISRIYFLILPVFSIICNVKNIKFYFAADEIWSLEIASVVSVSTPVSMLQIKDFDLKNLCNNMFDIRHPVDLLLINNCNISDIENNFFEDQTFINKLTISYNNISTIRRNMFVNFYVQNLDLGFNQISTIEEEAFAKLPILKKLVLYFNRITNFNSNWFSRPSNLISLSLVFNQIEILDEGSFTFLTQDNANVSLTGNKIKILHPKGLNGLTAKNLTLYLNENRIREIPLNFFQNYSFKILDFRNNLIKNLPNDFFTNKFHFEEFVIDTLNEEDEEMLYEWRGLGNCAFRLSITFYVFFCFAALFVL